MARHTRIVPGFRAQGCGATYSRGTDGMKVWRVFEEELARGWEFHGQVSRQLRFQYGPDYGYEDWEE